MYLKRFRVLSYEKISIIPFRLIFKNPINNIFLFLFLFLYSRFREAVRIVTKTPSYETMQYVKSYEFAHLLI